MRPICVAVFALVPLVSAGCGGSPTTPTATIFRQGTLTIGQTHIADLDTGTLVSNPLGTSDVWFEAVTNDERYLTPTGARLAVSGMTAPGFAVCDATTLTASRIPVATLTTGLYLCARTDEARIVEIRVVEPPGPGGVAAALTISFTTYNK